MRLLTRRAHRRQDQRGVVLALVLILAFLLSASVFAFTRRAVIDAKLIKNRDQIATAEALARGGIRLAILALQADLLAEQDPETSGTTPGDSYLDGWAVLGNTPIRTPEGAVMRISIRDQGAFLNLNALRSSGESNSLGDSEALEYLVAFLGTVIDELPIPPGERALYQARDLAYNLLDYMDEDTVRVRGGDEDDYYQRQDPPYLAANEPLLSVDELRRVEGFDAVLVDGIRPYVTVFPLGRATGINLNSAPAHVLKMVYHGTSGDRRLASEDTIRRILRAREDGRILCDDGASDDRCIQTSEILDGSAYPEAALPGSSQAFTIEAAVRLGDVRRTIEAVVDRSDPIDPHLLSWQVR